jgi:2-polyprenyl-3-methyl-5-hydroxy-6-metoxy-1,4-benzoquinol methylase
MKVMDVGCSMGFFPIGMAKMHVSAEAFRKTLEIAQSTGLRLCGQPAIRFSLTALFESI